MEAGTKKILLGVSALASLGLGALMVSKVARQIQAKKEKERQDLLQEELSGSTNWSEQSQSSSYDPSGDIKLLAGYIHYPNMMYYPDEVDKVIFGLTDSELKKLADAWKAKYNKSLYKSLDDEWDGCGFFENCYKSAMNRLSSLGMR